MGTVFAKNLFRLSFAFFCVGIAFSKPALSDTSKKVEDLFIWKVSDELKLSTKQEQQFSKMIRDLGAQKAEISEKIQKNILALSLKKGKGLRVALTDYKKSLKELNQINLREIELIEGQFGPEKAAQYIQLKQTLAEQIKSALSR
jgi:hypothetical protein